VLLPPEWAAEYTEQKAVTLPKLALELDTCSKRAKIETESLAGQLVIERAYAKKLEDLLSRGTAPAQVPKAEEAPWYQAPLFVFIGGVLVGGGLVIGASAVR
jgi:hypothetical protein